MSRQELAEAVNSYVRQTTGREGALDANYIGKLERGVISWPRDHYRAGLRSVLGVATDGELGFRRPSCPAEPRIPTVRSSRSVAALADLCSVPSVSDAVSTLVAEDLSMDRRTATLAITGVLWGAPLLEPVERCLLSWGSAVEEIVSGHSVRGLRDWQVEDIETTAVVFRRWDDRFGGGLRRKAVVGQLSEVADLLQEPQPEDMARRLLRAIADLSETAAIMSWDSGRQALAQRYYVLAFRAAHAGEDLPFAANVLAGMARQLLYLNRPTDALELVRRAFECTRASDTPALHSMLHLRQAWGFAHQGRISAFRRSVDAAEATLAGADRSEDPEWIDYFDAAELNGTVGGRLLELSRNGFDLADEAAERIELAIDLRRPGRLRSNAMDHLGLAEARLISGEAEEAAHWGQAAVDVAERTTSERVGDHLASLYRRTEAHRTVPSVATLRSRLIPLMTVAP